MPVGTIPPYRLGAALFAQTLGVDRDDALTHLDIGWNPGHCRRARLVGTAAVHGAVERGRADAAEAGRRGDPGGAFPFGENRYRRTVRPLWTDCQVRNDQAHEAEPRARASRDETPEARNQGASA